MKYSSTHRSLNTVLFGILAAGFITLVVFLTFFWTPHCIDSHYLASVSFIETEKSFAFNANLSVLCGALAIVSVIGFVTSVKSLINDKNDELVVDSYLCYIALGYVLAIFFALNTIWLYGLIGGEEATFWIVLCILGAIAAMIASNVPMMKLLEDDKTNRLSMLVCGSFASVAIATFVTFFYSLIVALASSYSLGKVKGFLVEDTIFALAASVLLSLAFLIYKKAKKVGFANFLTYLSLLAYGLIPLFSGIKELIFDDKNLTKNVSLMTINGGFAGTKYCVFAIITGGLIVLGALVLMFVPNKQEKKDN